ncbi:hypothetical protein GCM10010399_26120 [Dactylosporangium fulvum]
MRLPAERSARTVGGRHPSRWHPEFPAVFATDSTARDSPGSCRIIEEDHCMPWSPLLAERSHTIPILILMKSQGTFRSRREWV